MLYNNFKKDLFSWNTLIILFLLITISLISFGFSLAERNEFQAFVGGDYSDINQDVLSVIIEKYTGIRLLFNYWFNSGLFSITLILLYCWCGAFLSPNLQNEKTNGFGNLIIVRSSYKKRLNQIIVRHSFYILSIVFISTTISTLFALFLGGVPTTEVIIEIGDGYQLKALQVALIIIIQIIWISLLIILVNIITMLSDVIIRNKYVLQSLPVIFFVFLPYLLGTMVGNLIPMTARIITTFFPEFLVTIISDTLNSSFDLFLLGRSLIPLIFFICISLILYVYNVQVFTRDYI